MTLTPDDTSQGFSLNSLNRFLDRTFGNGRLAIERVGGGQSNPTFFVDHGERRMVLRKKPSGSILKGAHAIEREFRVLQALASTNVPVPQPLLLHSESDVVGTPFYLMERLEGRVFHDCSLPDVPADQRRSMYFAMADAMAALHSIRPDAIGLSDFGRPGNYFERQVSRWWLQYEESPSERIPELDDVGEWLRANIPEDDGRIAVAHGDFRLGNILFHPTRPEVVAILDWELSTLGHPLADLGFCCMPWRTTPQEYGGILGLDLEERRLPNQAEFVTRYFAGAVPTEKLQRFHVAFALFRFAVIFVGIADRALLGNAASSDAMDVAPLARRFAKRAEEVVLEACELW